MTLEPIAYFKSPFTSKFGIPRQSGLVPELRGEIRFTDSYRRVEAVRGLEGFNSAATPVWVSSPPVPLSGPIRLACQAYA